MMEQKQQSCEAIMKSETHESRRIRKVCVTGGTGFIASHLIKSLLLHGYFVTTTVRDADKAGYLREMEGAKERLKIVKADLMEDGSFDSAVEDVEGVFHAASPVLVPHDDRIKETLIDPAVHGTLNLLKSCVKFTNSIRRVVLTSSCSSIRYDYHRNDVPFQLDESCWSNLDYCSNFNLWYAYAKTVAEKEAWKLAEKSGLDLVVMNPSFVVGPFLSPQPTSTICLVLGILTGENGGVHPNTRMGFVHIDDVVAAHLLVMEREAARGRFICSGEVSHWKDIVKKLKAKYPMYPISLKCGTETGNDMEHSMNVTKIKELGLHTFKSIEQMFDDCIQCFREKGFLPS